MKLWWYDIFVLLLAPKWCENVYLLYLWYAYFTCGLTSRMQTLPDSITSWMEFILVPYRLPSYSPCSRKRPLLMSTSISLRDMNRYICPSFSSTLGLRDVSTGQQEEIRKIGCGLQVHHGNWTRIWITIQPDVCVTGCRGAIAMRLGHQQLVFQVPPSDSLSTDQHQSLSTEWRYLRHLLVNQQLMSVKLWHREGELEKICSKLW